MENEGLSSFEKQLINEVNKEKLMDYDRGIAKYIRNSGTEEELKAFKYIESVLEEKNIKTKLTFSDGYVSLPISAKLVVNGEEYPCLTHSMSTSVDNLQGELIYVKNGLANSYEKIDAKGKIVVIDGLAMGAQVKLAETNGAVGAMFLNDEHIHNMIGSCIWGSPSIEDFDTLPKIPFLSVNSDSAEKIKDTLKKGLVKTYITTKVQTGWRKLPTLEGVITGTKTPEKFLLLSNHVDSWIYGAMDNGTANAALMHVVEILNKYRDKLQRSIKICFWSGHSHGRYAGSTWYCDTHYEDLYDNCFLHINADSLGGKGSDILTEANAMAETKGLAIPIIKAICNQKFNGSRYGRAGDQSFWGTGTPSLFMGLSEQPLTDGTAAKSFAALMGNGKTGGFGWWWHSSEDTVDKIDPVALERDCKVYLLAVYRACSLDYLPIDQFKAAKDIENILKKYATIVGNKIDMQELLSRANKLVILTDSINTKKKNLRPTVYNEYSMKMSQILIPLNYVEWNAFEHDRAVRGKDLPKLSVLQKFGEIQEGSDAWKFITVVAQRRINEVSFNLRKAVQLAENYASNLGDI